MKRVCVFVFAMLCAMPAFGVVDPEFSCGEGYVLEKVKKTDGIDTYECQKLWCRDLETGRAMGTGNAPASGYVATPSANELCDANGNCVVCWGERKWCSGVAAGAWNPEYGAYTRGGADNATYLSYQKGGCFAWRLEKPECGAGETAILQDGEWVCAIPQENPEALRKSTIRRTGQIRQLGR
ncbi:MAG: hypothetical protein II219_00650 [Alphaproteobacteria bacterium]|nr:hypothetical protein [Alphaproteobacteria bacterium]